jgi:signal transduction histidine kinase
VGRLFWKFFLCIFLAQLAATVGIGGAFWLRDQARAERMALDIDTSPPARTAIDAAAATLQYGGTNALRDLLSNMQRHRVFAVDEKGHDLLGRIVKSGMLVEARYMMQHRQQDRVVREILAADGHRYMLFLPSQEHLRGLDSAIDNALDGDRHMEMSMSRPPMSPGGGGPLAGAAGALASAIGGQPGQPGGPGGPGMMPGPQGMGGGPPFDTSPLRTIIPIVAATLASLLFAAVLAWYFSRPIRALRQAFEAASGGNLAPRFAANVGKPGDELNDLGLDFDRMTDRLRKLMDGQTRLLHDVSHELRSPLARLQAAIGLAHQQPDKVAASLTRIERESMRMDKLVGELLTLSRLEAGALNKISDEINLADLVDDIVADANFEAASQHRHIDIDGSVEVMVIGNADLLGRAIENVVRNAIKHSPESSTVQVRFQLIDGGQRLCLQVLDRGPGVAQDEIHAIFEPFFRSNVSENNVDGHGLGLAIARHVLDAHGGSIVARNRDQGGLAVDITLPLARGGKALL